MRSLATLMCLGLFAGAAAGAPLLGLYQSPTAGYDFLSGRWSESFAGGGEGQIGNVVHSASWDGMVLATEWEVAGPTIDAPPVLIADTVNPDGDGVMVYLTTYSGGTITLTDLGPWWNPIDAPETEYVVDIDLYNHTTTMVFAGGQRVGYTTSIYMRGTFPDYPEYEISFLQAVALPHGTGPLPPDYPGFIGATTGAYGEVQKIRMEIVPEPAAFALMLGGGCVALLRRRNRRTNA